MPFTQPPKYDQTRETWPDFVGQTVVVEPIKKLSDVPTKFGASDAYEAIVWVLGDGDEGLIPHAGIRIFNSRIVAQLEVAQRMDAPIAGVVERNGQSIQLIDAPPEITEYLSKIWDGKPS